MKGVEELLAGRKADGRSAGGRLHLGEIVGGWRVEAFLGSGRSAEVYRVVSVRMGGEGALKLLADGSYGLRERFDSELEAVRNLALPCLPRFYGSGERDGRPYYVMEYLQPLFLPLERREVARFAQSLAAAVQMLHDAGYLHRDLKPANVLRRRNGEPVLIDLGLVKRRGETAAPGRPGVSVVDGKAVGVGTPGFAAPEQLIKGEASERGDVYALGKMLKASGGKRLGHAMRAVVRKATADDPADRYESAAEFAAAVASAASFSVRFLKAAAVVVCLAAAAGALYARYRPRVVPVDPAPPVPAVVVTPATPAPAPAAVPAAAPSAFALEPGEEPEAFFARVRTAADRGETAAANVVAEAYYHGRGVATNRAEAVRWYRRAAEAGDADAEASLGRCLLHGDGCERDPDEAILWYFKAAQKGNVYACDGLALCFLNGIGVDRDDAEGFLWARKAAEKGYASSERMVGECFLLGRGVKENREKALFWLQSANRHGDRRAADLMSGFFGD